MNGRTDERTNGLKNRTNGRANGQLNRPFLTITLPQTTQQQRGTRNESLAHLCRHVRLFLCQVLLGLFLFLSSRLLWALRGSHPPPSGARDILGNRRDHALGHHPGLEEEEEPSFARRLPRAEHPCRDHREDGNDNRGSIRLGK